jgi:glycosyltransferase involved in cell wall biosynthesis
MKIEYRWNSMNTRESEIDVVMPTWNSNKPYFEQVIKLIKEHVPVHRFIVVDRFSRDGTLSVIKKYFPDAMIIQTKVNLAVARKIGILHTDCEYIGFIDDDVFITKGWFPLLYNLMKNFQIGMIYTLGSGLRRPGTKTIEIVKKRDEVGIYELLRRGISTIRGRTAFTMVRRSLVVDWDPPKELSSLEDYHLTQHVLNKGALVVQVNLPLAIHVWGDINAPFSKKFRKSAWTGAGLRVAKAMNLVEVMLYGLARMIQVLLPGNIERMRYAGFKSPLEYMLVQLGLVIGYLSPYKYLVLERTNK